MGQEFDFQDLSDSAFWGVDLQRSTFRDVDLTGARVSHSRLVDVDIDAVVGGLVVNGVDVTAYVNERDPWFFLRRWMFPTEPDAMRAGWQDHSVAWERAIDRAHALPDAQRHASVDGEFSFVQTLRHVVFATDKWFTVPVLGGEFHPLGLPNTGSLDFGWPGLDLAAAPTFDDAVGAWRDRAARVRTFVADVSADALVAEVEVLENGPSAVHDCVGVVFEEHFQHLRYALRDLDRLG